MKTLFGHIKTYVFRGFLAAVPFALAFIAVNLIYTAIDQRVMGTITDALGFNFPGFGILLAFLALYVLGLAASNMLGREALSLIDRVTSRIPLVNTIYRIGKQLADTFSLPEKQVFKRALLVQYLKPETWVIGFMTGTVIEQSSGERLLKIYVPMPPNPLAGLVLVVRETETRDPGWSVEDALKTVMSGGIIGPVDIK